MQACFKTRNVLKFSFDNCSGRAMVVSFQCWEDQIKSFSLSGGLYRCGMLGGGAPTRWMLTNISTHIEVRS